MGKFYNSFHSNIRIQTKVISENNFTYRNTIGILDPLIKAKKLKILDYGCGVGTIDFYLASKGHKVVGQEISVKALRMCKNSAKAIGVFGNVKFVGINKKSNTKFDVVVCSEVIEHVPEDMKLLEKLIISLKRNGFLVVSVPSVNAPLYKLKLAKKFDRKVGHLRRYNSSQLIKKLKNSNLRIVKVEKVEGILRNSLFLYPRLGWIIRFLRGPLSDMVTFFDNLLVKLFGESNIYIIAQKK